MPKIRGGSDRPQRPASAGKASGRSASKSASKTKAASETKKTAKAKDTGNFPRNAWKDTEKLTGVINRTKDKLGLQDHPRLRHTKVDRDPIGGTPTRPPVVARYGLIQPTPENPGNRPPIVARYGLIAPGGGGGVKPPKPSRPPIVARYGLIQPTPENPGNRPPIVARYGLIAPGGGGGVKPPKPDRPPIVARYGLIMPRPSIETQPRPGIKHR